jgi:hypothetical protein
LVVLLLLLPLLLPPPLLLLLLLTNVSARCQAQASNEPRTQVTDNVTIQVWHHHDVKFAGVARQLQPHTAPEANSSKQVVNADTLLTRIIKDTA